MAATSEPSRAAGVVRESIRLIAILFVSVNLGFIVAVMVSEALLGRRVFSPAGIGIWLVVSVSVLAWDVSARRRARARSRDADGRDG